MQQSKARLRFAWRTTSLRVGGQAARRSCLPGLRRGGGDRQAGATFLSCLVCRCELTAGQVRSASECVRRSHCAARHSYAVRTCRADSVHTATPDTTRRSCLCRVWCAGVNWTIAPSVSRLQIFLSATVLSRRESSSHGRGGYDTDKTVLSCLTWRCELALSE